MTVVAPIHTEAVGLANLRFFAPPLGARELPYVAVDDLHACLTLPRELRRHFKASLRSSKWKDDTFTVATADGIVNLVPHYMAQGLIQAMQEVGHLPTDFYHRYVVASAAAMGKLTDGFSPDEMVSYMLDAWRNVGGNPGGAL